MLRRGFVVRIAALSDLHIGARRHTDAFMHDLDRFGRLLDRLEDEHDRIVLLGDIFQTDHSPWPGPAAATRMLERAWARVSPLSDRFGREPYVYVHGNHDEIARSARGCPEQQSFPGRVPALFIHGHQFDPIAVKTPVLADLGTWTTGRLRAMGLRPVAWWLEQRDVSIKDRRFRGPQGPYARGAERLIREHGTPIVVMGHTHCPGITPVEAGVMVNTGTCSHGRTMWVSVDTEDGRIVVHRDGQVESYRVPS